MGHDDDFLVPSDVDRHRPCASLHNVILDKSLLVCFAALSVVCNIYLIWMYFVVRSPILRRHPTTVAMYKCLFDVFRFQQYLWTPALRRDQLYMDDLIDSPYYCRSSHLAALLSFVSQVSTLGGELTFVVISMDLRTAYTNPLASLRKNHIGYAIVVLSISIATGIGLMLMGTRVYGVSSNGFIWFQTLRDADEINYPKLVLFYWMIILSYTYSIWVNFRYLRMGQTGLSKTISNRISIMDRSRTFVVGYVCYGCLLLILDLVQHLDNNDSRIFSTISAYFNALSGVYNFSLICYTNWSDFSWQTMSPFLNINKNDETDQIIVNVAIEKLLLQPHMNTALRAEILYFTTQGIIFATKECEKDLQRAIQSDRSDGNLTNQAQCESDDVQSQISGGTKASIPTSGYISDTTNISQRVYSGSTIFESNMAMEPSRKTFSGENAGRPDVQTHRASDGNEFGRKYGGIADLVPNNSAENIIDRSSASRVSYHSQSPNDDVEFESRSSASSYRLSTYQQIAIRQSSAVAKELESELQNEVQSMISDRVSVSISSKSFSKNNESDHNRSSMKTDRNDRSTFASIQNRSSSYMSYGRSGVPHDNDARLNQTQNPLTASKFTERHSEVEMNERDSVASQIDKKKRPISVESKASGSSDSTLKWRDTMDVVFDMRQNTGPTYRGSDQRGSMDSDYPTWQRIKRNGYARDNIINMPNNEQTQRTPELSNSTSTFSSAVAQRLRLAFQQAADIAQGVLNPLQKQFRFKDFRPLLFARIREISGVNSDEYARSFESTCKESFSDGRSGAFMFYSSDQKYIVKTTTKEEMTDLQSILVEYMEYLEANPRTLLVRFLGAHCLTMYGVELYFVVMLNFFPRSQLSERYDLKGSWENRHGYKVVNERLRIERCEDERSPLYFDNDLQHRIAIDKSTTYNLADQISRDIMLLARLQRMDYSLLVGVNRARFEVVTEHGGDDGTSVVDSRYIKESRDGSISTALGSQMPKVKLVPQEELRLQNMPQEQNMPRIDSNNVSNLSPTQTWDAEGQQLHNEIRGIPAQYVEGPGTYYIGIIDILQGWTWKKRLEQWVKVYLQGQDGDGISAIAPVPYAQRFWKRCVLDTFEGLTAESAVEGNKLWQSKVPVRRIDSQRTVGSYDV